MRVVREILCMAMTGAFIFFSAVMAKAERKGWDVIEPTIGYLEIAIEKLKRAKKK